MIRPFLFLIVAFSFSSIISCKSDSKNNSGDIDDTDSLQISSGDTITFLNEIDDDGPIEIKEGELYLSFNPVTGKTYVTDMQSVSKIVQTVNGNTASNTMHLSAANSLKVGEKNSNGNFMITSSVKSFKSSVTEGTIEVSFESGKKSSDPDADMLRQVMDCYIDMPVVIEMDKNARILNVTGVEAIQNKIQTTLGNEMVAVSQQMSDLNQEVLNSFVAFPRKSIKPGDTWVTVDSVDMGGVPTIMKNTYTLTDFNSEIAYIAVKTDFTVDKDLIRSLGGTGNEVTMTGGQSGNMQVDAQSGWTKSASLKQDVKMKIEDQGQVIEVSISGATSFMIK
ncbi:MAG: DUF6263 family protein [Chitinophagales bacterium]